MSDATDTIPSGAAGQGRSSRVAALAVRVVPFLVSGLILAFQFAYTDAASLFGRIDFMLLLPAAACSLLLNGLVGSWKFKQVLSLCGIETAWRRVLRFWASLWVTIILPFQTGHLVYVAALKNEAKTTWATALEAVAYDRYVTLVGTMTLVLLGQLIVPNEHILARWWILALAGGALVFYAGDGLFLWLLGRVPFLRERFSLLSRRPPLVVKARLLLLALLYQTSEVIAFFFACRALGGEVGLEIALGAYPVVLLLSLIPITVSGFGAREAFIVLFLGSSLSISQGVVAGVLVDVIEHLLPALAGVVFLRYLIAVLAGRGPGLTTEGVK